MRSWSNCRETVKGIEILQIKLNIIKDACNIQRDVKGKIWYSIASVNKQTKQGAKERILVEDGILQR